MFILVPEEAALGAEEEDTTLAPAEAATPGPTEEATLVPSMSSTADSIYVSVPRQKSARVWTGSRASACSFVFLVVVVLTLLAYHLLCFAILAL